MANAYAWCKPCREVLPQQDHNIRQQQQRHHHQQQRSTNHRSNTTIRQMMAKAKIKLLHPKAVASSQTIVPSTPQVLSDAHQQQAASSSNAADAAASSAALQAELEAAAQREAVLRQQLAMLGASSSAVEFECVRLRASKAALAAAFDSAASGFMAALSGLQDKALSTEAKVAELTAAQHSTLAQLIDTKQEVTGLRLRAMHTSLEAQLGHCAKSLCAARAERAATRAEAAAAHHKATINRDEAARWMHRERGAVFARARQAARVVSLERQVKVALLAAAAAPSAACSSDTSSRPDTVQALVPCGSTPIIHSMLSNNSSISINHPISSSSSSITASKAWGSVCLPSESRSNSDSGCNPPACLTPAAAVSNAGDEAEEWFDACESFEEEDDGEQQQEEQARGCADVWSGHHASAVVSVRVVSGKKAAAAGGGAGCGLGDSRRCSDVARV